MDSLLARHSEAYGFTLHRFLDSTSGPEGNRPAGASIIAQLCVETTSQIQNLLEYHSHKNWSSVDAPKTYNSLKRSYSRLRLWSDGYGISDGHLDDLFAKSKNVRHGTLKILVSISKTATIRLIPLMDADPSSEDLGQRLLRTQGLIMAAKADLDDDDDASDYDSDSLSEAAEDLKIDTMDLMELDSLFEDPVLDAAGNTPALATSVQDWAPEGIFSRRLSLRFPRASQELIYQLGRANYERYLRCHHNKEEAAPLGATVEIPSRPTSALHHSAFESSKPSGLGAAMIYPGFRGSPISVPSLPRGALSGLPFQCVACGQSVRVWKKSDWKRHLFQDLKPWLCMELSCIDGEDFSSRDEWIAHLVSQHLGGDLKISLICPLCHEEKINIQHLEWHLEEISLFALPSHGDVEDETVEEGTSVMAQAPDSPVCGQDEDHRVTQRVPEAEESEGNLNLDDRDIAYDADVCLPDSKLILDWVV